MKFTHDYDFGTPTTLKLTVVDTYQGENTEAITLLARNLPLAFSCTTCGEPAIYADAMNLWEDELHFYCEKCGKKAEKNEEGSSVSCMNIQRIMKAKYYYTLSKIISV